MAETKALAAKAGEPMENRHTFHTGFCLLLASVQVRGDGHGGEQVH